MENSYFVLLMTKCHGITIVALNAYLILLWPIREKGLTV